MADEKDFNQQVLEAIQEKTASVESELLPDIQSNYRMHLSLVQNIFEALVNRSTIVPDPYKKEKKFTEITCPESTDFPENKRAMTIGVRLSDYESTLDYVCNFFKFSVDTITLDKVQKLTNLNNTFYWGRLSSSASHPNSKGLGDCIIAAKNGGPQITISTLTDGVNKSADLIDKLNKELAELGLFIRERYKADIRKKVMGNPYFNKEKAYKDKGAFLAEIKKVFQMVIKGKAFSTELAGEIIQEEIGADKENRRQKVLSLLKVEKVVTEEKKQTVDTHEMLMEAVRGLGGMAEQYNIVAQKIIENNSILQTERNTWKEKLFRFIRKIFGIKESPIDYEITVTEKATGAKRKEIIHYVEFVSNIQKRAKYYAAISVKKSPGYVKISRQKDAAILDFLTKQLSDNGRIHVLLTAIDEFFKDAVNPANRNKVKGLQMELTTLKNSILNVNSHCEEYKAYVEEQEQFKKLGIEDA